MRIQYAQVLATAVMAATSMIPGPGFARTAASHTGASASMAKVKYIICPNCKMKMYGQKSAGAPKRVHVGNHYYYCCTGCGPLKTHTSGKTGSRAH